MKDLTREDVGKMRGRAVRLRQLIARKAQGDFVIEDDFLKLAHMVGTDVITLVQTIDAIRAEIGGLFEYRDDANIH